MAEMTLFFIEFLIGIPLVIGWGFFARRRGYSEETFWIGAVAGTIINMGLGVAQVLVH